MIRQSNDVTWDNFVFSGGDQAGCSPMMSLESRHSFGDVSDNTNNVTFHNLNLISPGQNATMFQIKGNAYGTAIGGVAANISLETPSFENAYGSSNVTMMDVRDTVGLAVTNPTFQYVGGTGIAALKLSEDNPCMTPADQDYRCQDGGAGGSCSGKRYNQSRDSHSQLQRMGERESELFIRVKSQRGVHRRDDELCA